MGADVALYDLDGEIATITLNRPERMNAMSSELFARLVEAWRRFESDDAARVAILTGAGDRVFCAGGDLREANELGGPSGFGDGRVPDRREMEPKTWKPVIGAVNGHAIGGGFWLAQLCDVRIASERARFGIPEVKWNLPAAWVTDLTDIIGLGHALELVLTGEPISAQRAFEIGFVNRVVSRDQVMVEARAMARILAENGPLAVKAHKEILYRGCQLGREDGNALADYIVRPLMTSEDSIEGPRAFVEQRKPIWKGR